MEHTDVCFAPVLTMSEAAKHPHNVERATFVELDGMMQPAPAPRFNRTVPEVARPPAHPGQHTREALADWGIPAERIDALLAAGAVVHADLNDGDDRLRPRPSRRRGHHAPAARWPGPRPTGHRVVLVVCTNGERGEVPDDLAEGETLVDRRRAETERSAAVLGRAPDRLARLPRLRDDRAGTRTTIPGRSSRPTPTRRPSGWRRCSARSRPTSSCSTTGTACTGIPTTSRCTGSGTGRRPGGHAQAVRGDVQPRRGAERTWPRWWTPT